MSPLQQVNKSQRGAALLPFEPDTEIMQGGLGGQPGLKAIQLVRALPVQPEDMVELLKEFPRFGVSQPASGAVLWARGSCCCLWAERSAGRRSSPATAYATPGPRSPCPPIPAQSRCPQDGQSGVGSMPEGEEILGQSLVLGAGRGKAETGDDALGVDGKQQVKAFIPAQAVAPANISLSGQPVGTPAFRVPCGNAGTVQHFVEAVPFLQQAGQTAEESRQGSVAAPGQPVELAAPWQGGESWPQAAGGVTVEVPFAAEACPLAEDDQGDYLALSQRSLEAGSGAVLGLAFAKVISHHIQYREEGVRIHHGQPLS